MRKLNIIKSTISLLSVLSVRRATKGAEKYIAKPIQFVILFGAGPRRIWRLRLFVKDISTLSGDYSIHPTVETLMLLGSMARRLFEMDRVKGLGSEDNVALVQST